MAVTDRMELKTQKKEAALTVNELLYLIFFGVMLFSKGMGWYDGMRPYQLCLLIGMGCLGLKLILTNIRRGSFWSQRCSACSAF